MKKISIGQLIINLIVGIFAVACLLPFILVVIVSFSSERSITMNGYSFFPTEWSLQAYRAIFNSSSSVPHSYLITIIMTAIGTVLAVIITYSAGYTLANKQCKYRNQLALYFYITMVFSAGMVPWYMVSRAIGAYDNILALIIPSLLFSPFNMFLVRNFIKGLPDSLDESARIDGANDIRIAFQIYFPLSVPVIAAITLFYALGYWNNYFNAVMLINNRDLYPLQMLLFNIQSEISMLGQVLQGVAVTPPQESFKMATCVVTMGPIILLYPYLQRYFLQGIVMGAVKE